MLLLDNYRTKASWLNKRSVSLNPLLKPAFNQLPKFNNVKPSHFSDAIETILDENKQNLEQLLSDPQNFSWNGLLFPLEKMEARLSDVWHTLSHLNSVHNSKELYDVYEALLPKLSLHDTEMMQNQKLYEAINTIKDGEEYAQFSEQQQKIVSNWLRDFRLSGITLPDEKKAIVKKLTVELSELESRFDQNILESTHSWSLTITDQEELKGLPERDLQAARTRAGEKPGFVLTLEFPCYIAVMTHVENRNIREQLYKAYNTRASDQFSDAKWNNTPLMQAILQKREQLASLLGFDNYMAYALQTRMVKTPEKAAHFLETLLGKVAPKANEELNELKQFAKAECDIADLQVWDVAFVSEKLREKTLGISDEQLRPYFPLSKVLEGLFSITHQLFGITVKEAIGIETWDDQVRTFGLWDKRGNLRGHFFVDCFARSNKQGGAWVSDGKTRLRDSDGRLQKPVTNLCTNFAKPLDEQDSLLSHDEVVTLFHEFGHCLHHTVTLVDYPSISGGSGVEWDAIECPSQLLENWCWEQEALNWISEHVETGESLPDEMCEKLKRSRQFQIGMSMLRQLEFGLLDLRLHTEPVKNTPEHVQSILDQIRDRTALLSIPAYNRFPNTFSHIFAGGYAAGYYSYLWSEVLSSDVYQHFLANGKLFDREVAGSFMENILEQGGSKDFDELFVAFQGRQPRMEALFSQWGL